LNCNTDSASTLTGSRTALAPTHRSRPRPTPRPQPLAAWYVAQRHRAQARPTPRPQPLAAWYVAQRHRAQARPTPRPNALLAATRPPTVYIPNAAPGPPQVRSSRVAGVLDDTALAGLLADVPCVLLAVSSSAPAPPEARSDNSGGKIGKIQGTGVLSGDRARAARGRSRNCWHLITGLWFGFVQGTA